MKRFMVLGSNSFSGSHFCKHLIEQGCKVLATSRSVEAADVFLPYKWAGISSNDLSFVQLDLNKDDNTFSHLLSSFRPEYIVNFAAQSMVAQSWDYPSDWVDTNVGALTRVIESLKTFRGLEKFVHVTTPEVYGSTADLISENHPFNPSTPYAVTRAAGDMMLKAFHEKDGLPVIFTRAANVFGPGQQLYRIIPRVIMACMTGDRFTLDGGGVSTRSFIHIQDVCNATFELAISAKPGETFHISSEYFITIRELVEKIIKRAGREFNEIACLGPERQGKDAAYLLSSEKLKSEFNWQPQVSLDEGIDQVFSWVRANIQSLEKLEIGYAHKK